MFNRSLQIYPNYVCANKHIIKCYNYSKYIFARSFHCINKFLSLQFFCHSPLFKMLINLILHLSLPQAYSTYKGVMFPLQYSL